MDLDTPPFVTSPVASADNEGAKGAKDTEDAKETKDTEDAKETKDSKDTKGAEEAVSLPAISFRSPFFVRGPQPSSPPAVIPSSHLPLSD